jgi:hypothetical protein
MTRGPRLRLRAPEVYPRSGKTEFSVEGDLCAASPLTPANLAIGVPASLQASATAVASRFPDRIPGAQRFKPPSTGHYLQFSSLSDLFSFAARRFAPTRVFLRRKAEEIFFSHNNLTQ